MGSELICFVLDRVSATSPIMDLYNLHPSPFPTWLFPGWQKRVMLAGHEETRR